MILLNDNTDGVYELGDMSCNAFVNLLLSLNEYELTIFVQEEEEIFRKFTENHFQKGYRLEQMKEALAKAGMEFVTAIDADTHSKVTEISERIYCIARESGK